MPAEASLDDQPFPPRAWCIPPAVAVAALCIYLLTVSAEVSTGDGAELSLQAHQLGVTHPPGYPVHTFLGKLFGLAISDPARATNVLSAVCTSVAVGLISAITLALTASTFAAALAPLIFAFTPTVWEGAVTTEVYNVNVCILGAALLLILSWYRKPSRSRLCAAGTVLGVSLGSSLANVLVLPGFAFLLWRRSRKRLTDLGLLTLTIVLAGSVVLSWSHIRSKSLPPLGTTYLPDTLRGLVLYLGAVQYVPQAGPPLGFYFSRIIEHSLYWAASFLWVGVGLGVVGFIAQWKQHRTICVALLLMFAANMGYFTRHPWLDYRDMVTPSYFIFAVWVAAGICSLEMRRGRIITTATVRLASLAIVLSLLFSGMRDHIDRNRDSTTTRFVQASFDVFPPDAVVVAKWDAFAPLLFFQQTRRLRPDVTIIERAEAPRHYQWGSVNDWRDHVYAAAASQPVIIDTPDERLGTALRFVPISTGWYGIVAPARDGR